MEAVGEHTVADRGVQPLLNAVSFRVGDVDVDLVLIADRKQMLVGEHHTNVHLLARLIQCLVGLNEGRDELVVVIDAHLVRVVLAGERCVHVEHQVRLLVLADVELDQFIFRWVELDLLALHRHLLRLILVVQLQLNLHWLLGVQGDGTHDVLGIRHDLFGSEHHVEAI